MWPLGGNQRADGFQRAMDLEVFFPFFFGFGSLEPGRNHIGLVAGGVSKLAAKGVVLGSEVLKLSWEAAQE